MHFTDLRMSSFRNYEALSLAFSPGINCFTGNNGEGKTNILEAIHYLCMTRGWVAKSEKFALREGDAWFSVEGELQEAGNSPVRIQCNYMPPKGKRLIIDRRPLERMSDHIGRVPLVAVLPQDTQIIHGTPGTRRRFMDALICQYAPDYLNALLNYENALTQRNALLQLMHDRKTWDAEQLTLWEGQLIPYGIEIAQHRAAFLKAFEPVFLSYFHRIVSDKEQPRIQLETQIQDNSPEAWAEGMAASRNRDRYALRTGFGVHKDDLDLSISGQAVKNYGSQGQQKTFAIALKLAQYDILQARCQKHPLLLLDDIFDKLDQHRLQAIASILDQHIQGQVFITDTSLTRMEDVFRLASHRPVRHFRVAQSNVKTATA